MHYKDSRCDIIERTFGTWSTVDIIIGNEIPRGAMLCAMPGTRLDVHCLCSASGPVPNPCHTFDMHVMQINRK